MSTGASNTSPNTVASCLCRVLDQLSHESASVRSDRTVTEVAPVTSAARTNSLVLATPRAKLSALVSWTTGAVAAWAGAAERTRADTATVLSTAPTRTNDMLLLEGRAAGTADAFSATGRGGCGGLGGWVPADSRRCRRSRTRGYHGWVSDVVPRGRTGRQAAHERSICTRGVPVRGTVRPASGGGIGPAHDRHRPRRRHGVAAGAGRRAAAHDRAGLSATRCPRPRQRDQCHRSAR